MRERDRDSDRARERERDREREGEREHARAREREREKERDNPRRAHPTPLLRRAGFSPEVQSGLVGQVKGVRESETESK